MIGNTMTKTVLCYGIILGLYCLVHEVHSTKDGHTSQHYNAKHKREMEDEYLESGKSKDQVFLKPGSPIQGRRIHQTAWSKEVTENSLEDLKVADRTQSSYNTGSWNFKKLLNYLLSLLNVPEEPEQVKMTPSEKVEMIKNKINAKIRERNKLGNDKRGSENLETKKETYATGIYLDKYTEDSYEESDESYAEEPCEESEDLSSSESTSENNGSIVEDCYEDEESEEISFSNKVTERTETSFKNKIAGVQSKSQNTHENNKIPGQEVIILNGTVGKEEKQEIRNNLPDTTSTESITKLEGTSTKSPSTKMNKDEVKPSTDTLVTLPTGSYINEPRSSNPISTHNGHPESVAQFIPSNPENLNFNIATESKTFLDEKSLIAADTILETHVTNSNSATETLPQDKNKVFISTPELPLIIKELQTSELLPLNIDVKPTMDEMINVSPTVTHNKQNEAQKFENLNTDNSEIQSQRKLQNQEEWKTLSEMSFDTSKTSIGDQDQTMIFTQEISENIDDNRLQQESFQSYGREDEILQEFNLGNEFIELSNIHEDKFQNHLQDYKMDNHNSEDESQHYSVIPQNVLLNEENEDQETFDTILEFLYKHSNNPLILSLRNSSKTLF